MLDFYLYLFERSESSSYWAHIGGIIVGMVAGTLCLDNLEVSDWEANVVMPATKLFAVVIAIVPLALYIAVYPPDEIALRPADFPPCCNQLLDCPGIERDEFAYFYCIDARYVKGGQQFRQTCEEQLYFVERRRANEG